MKMELTRRSLLKAAAATAALSVAGVTTANQPVEAAKAEEADTWKSTPCRFCGTGCGLLIGTKGGKVVAVKGDPDCESNKGLNCIKGYYIGKILYGEDRFTKPMIRTDKSTKGTRDGLKEATWEEALELVASKLTEAHSVSPKSIAFYASAQQSVVEGYTIAKLWKAGLLSNNIDPNARLCMASAVTGFMSTFNSDEPMGSYKDLEAADLFITWGSNMAEAHPVLHGRLAARKVADKNVKHYDLTTVQMRNAETADELMLFKPGSDLAILNAVANYIIQNNGVDQEFVKAHCNFKTGTEFGTEPTNMKDAWEDGFDATPKGSTAAALTVSTFDEFKAKVAEYTLEKAAEISGVPAEKIKLIGDAFCNKDLKIVSYWTMGANQHNRGTWVNNLFYNIHLLTGKISKPGCGPFSLTGQPSACGSAREPGVFSHRLPADLTVDVKSHRKYSELIWGLPIGYLDAIQVPGFHTVKIFRELSKGNIKFLWSMCNNWGQTMPKLNRFRGNDENAKGVRDAFIVVSEPYPTRSTELADVVFPPAMYIEREGQYVNAERRMQVIHKCVEGPGETKSDLATIIEVANRVLKGKKIGDKDAFDVLFGKVWKDGKPIDDHELNKTLFDEYRLFTNPEELTSPTAKSIGKKLKVEAKQLAPYDVYYEGPGLTWPTRKVGDKWLQTSWRYAYGKQEDGYDQIGIEKMGDKDAYGKVSFYKSADKKPNIIFRPYETPAEMPDAEYPLWFCTGRLLEHWHTGSMTRRVPELDRACPEGFADFHPDDAAALGIKNGDLIKISSRRGSFEIKAAINGRNKPQKGLVFAPFNFEESMVNYATLDVYCPISKEPDFKKCAIKVEKV